MNSRRTFFSCLIIALGAATITADMNKVGNHNIGAAAGFVTGYGLSYRQWLGDWGFQLTTAPFHQEDEDESNTVFSVGATVLRKIREAKLVNLFVYLGPHYHLYRNVYTHTWAPYEPYAPSPTTRTEETVTRDRILFFGAGPGLDFHFLKISLSVMCGFVGYRNFDDRETGVHFSGESALYYSF